MTKGSRKNRRKDKNRKKGKKNNHTHKKVSHKHNGKKKHYHKIDNANYDVNLVVGDYNSNIGNKHIMTKRGGETEEPKTKSKPKTFKKPKNKLLQILKLVNNSKNFVFGNKNKNIGSNINNSHPIPQQEEEKMEIDKEEKTEEKIETEIEEEDHEIDEILEYIDINYIMNEENSIENIMDYISYCVYQWELYKDYMIPKDEYYQNMIDELYNDSLYTNNVDKDYDFI